MKKLLCALQIIVILMISASCDKEAQETSRNHAFGDKLELTFDASFSEETKTILVNGNEVWWQPGDMIDVKGADSPFECISDEPSATARFTGTVEYASEYYAVYPYGAGSFSDKESGVAYVELPVSQEAVRNTFADDLNIAVAKTTHEEMSFHFKNVLGYIKFTIAGDDESIVSMTVSTQGLGEEYLAGTLSVNCTADAPSAAVYGSKGSTSVSLVSETVLSPGDYYLALLPGTYSEGLAFIFTDDQGRTVTRKISQEVSLSKGQIRYIGVIGGLDFSNGGIPDDPVDGDYFVIDIPIAGTLSSTVSADILQAHDKIKLTGNCNTDDVAYFTQNASNVVSLDLSALSFEDNVLDGGFNSLSSLKEVHMPAAIKEIKGNAFSRCEALEDVKWDADSQLQVIGMGLRQDLWYNVIYEGPFSYCTSLKSIDIPANVTEIKTTAFYGSGISAVNFAEDAAIDILEATQYYVTNNLGASQPVTGGMFMGCNYLETIEIPESVLMVSDYAFKGWTGLKRLEIPESVKYISATGLFYGCSRLEYVSVPSSLKVIPDHMFNGCSSLTDFDFAGGYTSIGTNAFNGCASLETIDLEGVREFGNGAFSGAGFVSIRIPDGMTEIPYELFFGCTKLKDIDFNQTEIIGHNALGGCDAIESLVIADPIKEDNGGFAGCANLKEITIASRNIEFSYGTFDDLPAVQKIVIGKDVISAGGNMGLPADFDNFVFEDGGCLEEFGLCCGLNITSIELPETVKRLSQGAFRECKNLTNIDDLLEGIEEIGPSAFYQSGVRSVNFPEGLKVIGSRAFDECEELRMITMPSTTTSIGSGAFRACPKLMTSTVNGAELSVEGDIFVSCPFISSITVGKDVKTFECNTLDKAITELIFEEGSQCTKITGNIFGSKSSVTEVILPPSLKEIGSSVFLSSKVSSIYLPESLEKIGDKAFYNYKANDDLIIPENVSEFGAQAFYGASGTKLTLNCRKTNDMQTSPFYKSTYTALELGSDVEYIGFALYADEIHCKGSVPAAFGKYGELKVDVIYVPNDAYKEYYLSWHQYADLLVCEDGTVPEITDDDLGISESADNAFFYRTSDNKMVDLAAFDNGAAGANVTSHTYLNGYFTIVFDGKVTTLPKSGFSGANLTELLLPEKLETIGQEALVNNPDLKQLIIPESVTSVYKSAFSKGVQNLSVVFDAISHPTFFDDKTYVFTGIGAKEFIVPYEGLLGYRSAALNFAPNIRTEDGSEPELEGNHLIYLKGVSSESLFEIHDEFGKETSTADLYDFGADKLYCTYHGDKYVLVFGGDVTRLPAYFGDSSSCIFSFEEAIVPSTVNCVDQDSLAPYSRPKVSRVLYFKSTVPPLMPERTISGGYDPPKNEQYLQTVYVPSQSVDAYKAAAGWSLYADRIVGYDY